jgi:hypothetical protein
MNGQDLYDIYMNQGDLSADELYLLIVWLCDEIVAAYAESKTYLARWYTDVKAIAEADYNAMPVVK